MNPFEQLQEELAGEIAALPLFATVEVLWEERGDIANEAERIQARQLSCVNILTPDASVSNPNLPGPFYDDVALIVEILDFPTVSKSEDADAPTARDMAHAIAALLQHFRPLATGQVGLAARPTIAREETGLKGAVLDVVRFNFPGLSTYEIPQLDAPTLDLTGDTLTITPPATPGVAVFYTTDGKHPAPRNGTLYTAPVDTSALAAGTRIKARAWLAGYLASDLASVTTPA